jgi:amino acid transporter
MFRLKSKLSVVVLVGVAMFMAAQPVVAQAQGIVNCGVRGSGYDANGQPLTPCTFQHLFELVYLVVNTLIGMAGLVAIFFIVWGGAQMLLSAGNMEKVQDAKRTIWNAILGLVLVLMSYLIISFVVGLILPGASGNPLRTIIDFIDP